MAQHKNNLAADRDKTLPNTIAIVRRITQLANFLRGQSHVLKSCCFAPNSSGKASSAASADSKTEHGRWWRVSSAHVQLSIVRPSVHPSFIVLKWSPMIVPLSDFFFFSGCRSCWLSSYSRFMTTNKMGENIGEIFGTIAWLWIFHRFRHDGKVLLGMEHPWEHGHSHDAGHTSFSSHGHKKAKPGDVAENWQKFAEKSVNPGDDDDDDDDDEASEKISGFRLDAILLSLFCFSKLNSIFAH